MKKTHIYEVNAFERNTIAHEVDQAMKEAREIEPFGEDIHGRDLVGGGKGLGNKANEQVPKGETLVKREVLEPCTPETSKR